MTALHDCMWLVVTSAARAKPPIHDEFKAPCPSFAMVCLELRRVTGSFSPRSRAQPSFSTAQQSLGWTGNLNGSNAHDPFGPAGVGAIVADLHGGGIAPSEK